MLWRALTLLRMRRRNDVQLVKSQLWSDVKKAAESRSASWTQPPQEFANCHLLVKDKLLGVDQCPENVLVGRLLVLGVLGDVSQSRFNLAWSRLVPEGPQEQFFHLFPVRPLVLGASQDIGP